MTGSAFLTYLRAERGAELFVSLIDPVDRLLQAGGLGLADVLSGRGGGAQLGENGRGVRGAWLWCGGPVTARRKPQVPAPVAVITAPTMDRAMRMPQKMTAM